MCVSSPDRVAAALAGSAGSALSAVFSLICGLTFSGSCLLDPLALIK